MTGAREKRRQPAKRARPPQGDERQRREVEQLDQHGEHGGVGEPAVSLQPVIVHAEEDPHDVDIGQPCQRHAHQDGLANTATIQ
jgi:hypothetical protein